jgi:hypothetical protein
MFRVSKPTFVQLKLNSLLVLPDEKIWKFDSVLTPFITKWANQPHVAYMFAGRDRSEKFSEIDHNMLRHLATVFIRKLMEILTLFEPGSGPMAILNTGEFVQVPSLTRVGDKI